MLTALNDNAAITYLATLVPGLTDALKYAVVAGAVTGGGLTVIANAPNPAGHPAPDSPAIENLKWEGHMADDIASTYGPEPLATLTVTAEGLSLTSTRGNDRLPKSAITKLGKGNFYPWCFSAVRIHHTIAGFPRGLQFKPLGLKPRDVLEQLTRIERTTGGVPAAVLLDLRLPRRGGFGVLNWIRSHKRFGDVPVIVVTGSRLAYDRHRAFALDATAFLPKFPSPKDLAAVLKPAVARFATSPPP